LDTPLKSFISAERTKSVILPNVPGFCAPFPIGCFFISISYFSSTYSYLKSSLSIISQPLFESEKLSYKETKTESNFISRGDIFSLLEPRSKFFDSLI